MMMSKSIIERLRLNLDGNREVAENNEAITRTCLIRKNLLRHVEMRRCKMSADVGRDASRVGTHDNLPQKSSQQPRGEHMDR